MKLSTAAASLAADAVCAQLDGGTLDLYSGTIPATANTALTDQILLATLDFQATAFAAAVDGIATAFDLDSEEDASASGDATFCLGRTPAGDPIFLGTVDVTDSGADCELDSVSVTAGGVVSITSCVYRQPTSA